MEEDLSTFGDALAVASNQVGDEARAIRLLLSNLGCLSSFLDFLCTLLRASLLRLGLTAGDCRFPILVGLVFLPLLSEGSIRLVDLFLVRQARLQQLVT